MAYHQAVTSFNGGELTPYLRYAIELAKRASGVATMRNFLPMPFGGVRKRPGLIHLASFPAETRLEGFNFSSTESYLFAFSATALAIYDPTGALQATLAGDFSDPFRFQFVQLNDQVFTAHPDHLPQVISHLADGTWTLAETPWSNPPLLDQNNDDDLTIQTDFPDQSGAAAWASGTHYATGDYVTYSGSTWQAEKANVASAGNHPGVGTYQKPVILNGHVTYVTRPLWTKSYIGDAAPAGQVINLIASADLFQPTHVGAFFKISKERVVDGFEVDLSLTTATDGQSSGILVTRKWTFQTFGNWGGTVTVQRQSDPSQDWEDIRSFTGNQDRNISDEGTEDSRVLLRIHWESDGVTAGSAKPRGVLTAGDAFIDGLVRIATVTDGQHATATVVQTVELTTTKYWTEGAFSDFQGYPGAIGAHERRLIYAGTRQKPMSLWLSKSDDLVNFEQGTDDDSSLYETLAGTRQDPIHWLASTQRLFIGTAGGEWVVGTDNPDLPVTPANFVARQRTAYGSTALPSIRIGDAIFFVERQARRLREFAYQITEDTYAATDLTRLAEHITEGGLTQLVWQSNREPMLWAIRADGLLLSFAYNRAEALAAWARHDTVDGQFRSLAVLRNDTGDDDVYAIVERQTGGQAWHLEKLASGQQLVEEQGDVIDGHYLDGILTTTPGGSFTVPPHLRGFSLFVLADGIYSVHSPDDSGTITLSGPATVVHCGNAVTAELEMLPFDIPTDSGPTLGRRKQARQINLNVYNSWGLQYLDGGLAHDVPFTTGSTVMDAAPVLFSGWKPITLSPAYPEDLIFTFFHAPPYPLIVRTAIMEWSVQEP